LSLERARVAEGEELFLQIVGQLRAAAQNLLRHQPPGHSLQPTALVNEAFLRLFGGSPREWVDHRHVLATAARAMRQVLIDHARKKATEKRDQARGGVPLDSVTVVHETRTLDVLAVEEALKELERIDAPMAQCIELRLFVGLEMVEIARYLGIPERSLQRKWQATRAWLSSRLC